MPASPAGPYPRLARTGCAASARPRRHTASRPGGAPGFRTGRQAPSGARKPGSMPPIRPARCGVPLDWWCRRSRRHQGERLTPLAGREESRRRGSYYIRRRETVTRAASAALVAQLAILRSDMIDRWSHRMKSRQRNPVEGDAVLPRRTAALPVVAPLAGAPTSFECVLAGTESACAEIRRAAALREGNATRSSP